MQNQKLENAKEPGSWREDKLIQKHFGDVLENTTKKTESSTLPVKKSEGSKEIQVEVLEDLSGTIKPAILASLSFADESMKELNLRLKQMFPEQVDNGVRTIDVEKVQTAALCARSIAELIKAKTEAMKLLTERF